MTFAEVEKRELESWEQEIKREGLDLIENREALMQSPGQLCEQAKWCINQFQEGFGIENLKKAIEILEGIK